MLLCSGQNGRSYQDEQCLLPEDSIYDCATQLNAEEMRLMEAHGFSTSQWGGAPGPLYCGPTDKYGKSGFWDAMVGREVDDVPTVNANGRDDLEGKF